MKILSASINLSKIDKSRIIKGKDGAQYYNVGITVKDEKDQYGNDVSVTQGQTKDERERKEKQVYIGNGRVVFSKEPEASPQPSENKDGGYPSNPAGETPGLTDDSLPF